MDDATLHGCIPVIIMVCGGALWIARGAACVRRGLATAPGGVAGGLQAGEMWHPLQLLSAPFCMPPQDNVHVSFESILDLQAFTLRIPEKDAERLPEVRPARACGNRAAAGLAHSAVLPLAC